MDPMSISTNSSSSQQPGTSSSSSSNSHPFITTATKSTLEIALHPLVLLNISDHFTRTRAQTGASHPSVFGALLGAQNGRSIEIFNSFELLVAFGNVSSTAGTAATASPIIDKEYFKTKQNQFKQVFPNYDFLGWYTTGFSVSEAEINVHKQACELGNESPLFLQLNTLAIGLTKDIPVSIYESVIDIVNGQPQMLFIPATYKTETGEAERISVDHIAKVSESDSAAQSKVTAQLSGQFSAIQMLYQRVQVIVEFLKAVKSGKVAPDPSILRDVASLCSRLPVLETPDFNTQHLKEYNDVMLISYLATVTKGCNSLNDLLGKFSLLQEGIRSKGGASFRGL